LRYERTHGPFPTEAVAARLALPPRAVAGSLAQLAARGRVVQGAFTPGRIGREWCETDVLRQIRQRSLAKLRQVSKLVGGILGPFEAYLTLRGVKTLGLRMPRQCDNARLVAERLAAHPRVERVYYPGLPSHPDFGVASRLLRDKLAGAVVTLALRGAARPEVFRLMDSLRLCCVGTTVGDIYTQMLYPPMSSHRALSAEERSQLGIGDNLVRLSVGIEEPEDVIADLEQALEAAMGTQSSRTQHEQHTRRTSS
jgi:hypothetical protein